MTRGLSKAELYCGPGVPGPCNVSPDVGARHASPAIAALLLLTATACFGHHGGLDRFYDLKQDVKIEGKIIQVLIRNPHSFVHIDVTNAEGKSERWGLEWDSVGALRKQGLDRTALHVGDSVVITVHPWKPSPEILSRYPALSRQVADSAARQGFIKSLERPSDGLSVGRKPKVSKKRGGDKDPGPSFGV